MCGRDSNPQRAPCVAFPSAGAVLPAELPHTFLSNLQSQPFGFLQLFRSCFRRHQNRQLYPLLCISLSGLFRIRLYLLGMQRRFCRICKARVAHDGHVGGLPREYSRALPMETNDHAIYRYSVQSLTPFLLDLTACGSPSPPCGCQSRGSGTRTQDTRLIRPPL